MWYNRDLDVLRIQYIFFLLSARCIRIWSAQRFFSLCSLSQYICFSHVHKFFRVSGLGISARARGNFMHNNILRHTSVQFAIRWAGT
jgi:hypothetical protein